MHVIGFEEHRYFHIDKQTGGWMDGMMHGWTGRWANGEMDRWEVDGLMDRNTDGRMGRQMDEVEIMSSSAQSGL